tara:strand:- start:185 stop:478 length:294 start_codon:yes stop_codon:yes gene_type:complete
MTEETKQQITYNFEDKSYDAHKFTDEGKIALAAVARLNRVIGQLTEQLNDAQAASITYKDTINKQLTDDMLLDEEPVTQYMDELVEDLPPESVSTEI